MNQQLMFFWGMSKVIKAASMKMMSNILVVLESLREEKRGSHAPRTKGAEDKESQRTLREQNQN